METKRIGRLASKAKGLVLGFLNNPNTYLIVGTWIFLAGLFRYDDDFSNLLSPGMWDYEAQGSRHALLLLGGMFAICRIAQAIEAGKASAGTPSHSSEKPE